MSFVCGSVMACVPTFLSTILEIYQVELLMVDAVIASCRATGVLMYLTALILCRAGLEQIYSLFPDPMTVSSSSELE